MSHCDVFAPAEAVRPARRLAPSAGLASAGLLLTLLSAAPAGATSLLSDYSVQGCGGENCSTLQLGGTVGNSSPNGLNENIQPFVTQVFAAPGECLRLDVQEQDRDLELTIVAPDGTAYRNDDRNGAADRRPLVKIANPPGRGWYTVQVSTFNDLPGYANFTLLYGRYNRPGNLNCTSPTPPLGPPVGVREAAK